MRVVCDNCGATYKIPEHKLVKEVNKATCRKCGHRMLIRRPSAAQAAPSAPAPAGGDEETRLTRSPLLPDPSASNPGLRPAGADQWNDEGPTRLAQNPSPAQPPDERPTVAIDAADGPNDPPLDRPTALMSEPPAVPSAPPTAQSAPEPAPQPAPAPQVAAAPAPVAPRPAPVAPQPAVAAPVAAQAHDPAGDLLWVGIGASLAAGGALALAANLTDSVALRSAGLGAAMFGALVGVLVLATGNRGRQKASVGLSVGIALLMSVLVVGVVEFGRSILEGDTAERPRVARRAPTPPPAPAPAEANEEAAAAFLAEDPPEEAAPVEEPEPEPEVVAAAAPAPAPARTEPTRSAPPREPAPTRSAPPPPPPEPEPEPEPAGRELNPTVVQTMIRSNKGIKNCFYEYKNANGSYPSRVDMRFTVELTGRVSSARVATRQYKGTDFDVCLGSAFRAIQFPPFDGDSQTMTYPFVL